MSLYHRLSIFSYPLNGWVVENTFRNTEWHLFLLKWCLTKFLEDPYVMAIVGAQKRMDELTTTTITWPKFMPSTFIKKLPSIWHLFSNLSSHFKISQVAKCPSQVASFFIRMINHYYQSSHLLCSIGQSLRCCPQSIEPLSSFMKRGKYLIVLIR